MHAYTCSTFYVQSNTFTVFRNQLQSRRDSFSSAISLKPLISPIKEECLVRFGTEYILTDYIAHIQREKYKYYVLLHAIQRIICFLLSL
ncbi:hypothetical protein APH_0781 [Anaplasma phagocytophilum str. HZ]|uniref:Uncharacterized protein n=1 Tax=Anaplasma phagocytophilum (strain HZ) TaxID=212042 RepID=Q2GJU3_ANAPZ|nr:hypothetical protein APH_0781 [Anaplasma phagocytophilum str. HZ]